MATLQQVHFKIREICKEGSSIPISSILQSFDDTPEVTKQIEALVHLAFIEFDGKKKDEIRLTLPGRLTTIP